VCAQNAIFCSQVFVLEKQFLIDQAGDVGEQAYPFVFSHLEPPSSPASSIRSDFSPFRHWDTARRVHGFFADKCPVYRSLKAAIDIHH
jgi:hypothetical protein